ncbi:hypothetical protein [Cryptosporangium arvum]|uniref:hypothetical protein n=1 Tax=Cryptosporangium arvum TaxID=80871 RepID=UPI0004BBF486|nr:hypothetical protein [Cryptosporangium arvum]
MTDVDWAALRTEYDTGVAELRAASSRFRQSPGLDRELRTGLADLFDGLADDAETTGPDPRALAVARALAAAAPDPALRQVEPPRVTEPVPVVASAVAHGRPATRADVLIARVAVAAASVWHRVRRGA